MSSTPSPSNSSTSSENTPIPDACPKKNKNLSGEACIWSWLPYILAVVVGILLSIAIVYLCLYIFPKPIIIATQLSDNTGTSALKLFSKDSVACI